MAAIIAVANQKGGTGKTTTTLNLAAEIKSRGYRVLVVDADPQGSAGVWASNASDERPFPVKVVSLASFEAKLGRELLTHAADCDLIFVDCPPHKTASQTLSACAVSQLVLMPLRPSHLDLDATMATLVTIEQAKAINPEIKIKALLNNVRAGTVLAREIVEGLASLDVPVMATRLPLTEELTRMVGSGETVIARSASPARILFSALADEVLAELGLDLLKKEAA